MQTLNYTELISEIFTNIAPKYDELNKNFIKEVEIKYNHPVIKQLFDAFYNFTMEADDDDYFEGYIDDNGENTRTYDMEWVQSQFEDNDMWEERFNDLLAEQ